MKMLLYDPNAKGKDFIVMSSEYAGSMPKENQMGVLPDSVPNERYSQDELVKLLKGYESKLKFELDAVTNSMAVLAKKR